MKAKPDNCTACKLCEQVCPTRALDIEYGVTSEYCIECYQCMAICQHCNEQSNKEIIGSYVQKPVESNDFELLLQQRRSIRDFKNKDVPNEVLKEFINKMRFSPTASNSQGLSFTVIKDRKTLKRINNLTIETLSSTFKTVINPFTRWLITLFAGKNLYNQMNTSKSKFLRKAKLNANMICYNAPALIIIHATSGLTAMPANDANIWLGMASLYAQTLDLGTCINGYIINAANRNKTLRKTMQIPGKNKVYGALLIGYPKVKFKNRVERNTPIINHIAQHSSV